MKPTLEEQNIALKKFVCESVYSECLDKRIVNDAVKLGIFTLRPVTENDKYICELDVGDTLYEFADWMNETS